MSDRERYRGPLARWQADIPFDLDTWAVGPKDGYPVAILKRRGDEFFREPDHPEATSEHLIDCWNAFEEAGLKPGALTLLVEAAEMVVSSMDGGELFHPLTIAKKAREALALVDRKDGAQ